MTALRALERTGTNAGAVDIDPYVPPVIDPPEDPWTANGSQIVYSGGEVLDDADVTIPTLHNVKLTLVRQPSNANVDRVEWLIDNRPYSTDTTPVFGLADNPPLNGTAHVAPSGESFVFQPGSQHSVTAEIWWDDPPAGTDQPAQIGAGWTVDITTPAPVIIDGPNTYPLPDPTEIWVVWETDIPSSSQVEWSLAPDTPPYDNLVSDPTHRTVHSMFVTGLAPGTTIEGRVRSSSAGGAVLSAEFTETSSSVTQPAWTADGSTIANLYGELEGQNYPANKSLVARFQPVTQPDEAIIEEIQWRIDGTLWNRDNSLPYDLNPDAEPAAMTNGGHYGTLLSFPTSLSFDPGSTHQIQARLVWFDPPDPTPAFVNFTNTFTIADEVPPVITSGPTVEILGQNTIRVNWTTDIFCSTELLYGTPTGPPYPNSFTQDEGFDGVTNHSITITGLNPGQQLEGIVRSCTPTDDLCVTSGEWTGTTDDDVVVQDWTATGSTLDTLAGPLHGLTYPANSSLGVHLTPVTQPAAAVIDHVEWWINDGSGGLKLYRDDDDVAGYDLTYSGGVPTGGQTFNGVDGGTANDWELAPGSSGNVVRAEIHWLNPPETTTQPAVVSATFSIGNVPAPVIVGTPTATPLSDTSIRVNWTTDRTADSEVEWEIGSGTVPFANDTTLTPLVTNHAVTLTGLTADTLYGMRVRSTNAGGNTGFSTVFTARTLEDDPPPPPGVYPKNQNQTGLRAVGVNPSGTHPGNPLQNGVTYTRRNFSVGGVGLTVQGGTVTFRECRITHMFLVGSGTVNFFDCDIYGAPPNIEAFRVDPENVTVNATDCVIDGLAFNAIRNATGNGSDNGADAFDSTGRFATFTRCWMRGNRPTGNAHTDVFQNNNTCASPPLECAAMGDRRDVTFTNCTLIAGSGDSRLNDITTCRANGTTAWDWHNAFAIMRGTLRFNGCFLGGGSTGIQNGGPGNRTVICNNCHFAPGWFRHSWGGVAQNNNGRIAPQSRKSDGTVGAFPVYTDVGVGNNFLRNYVANQQLPTSGSLTGTPFPPP